MADIYTQSYSKTINDLKPAFNEQRHILMESVLAASALQFFCQGKVFRMEVIALCSLLLMLQASYFCVINFKRKMQESLMSDLLGITNSRTDTFC